MLRINWKRDWVGFLNTWVLIGIGAGSLIAVQILFILGLCAGNWDTYFEPIKYIIISWYVISMVAVLIRIGVYRVGILREQERLKNSENQKSKDNS